MFLYLSVAICSNCGVLLATACKKQSQIKRAAGTTYSLKNVNYSINVVFWRNILSMHTPWAFSGQPQVQYLGKDYRISGLPAYRLAVEMENTARVL